MAASLSHFPSHFLSLSSSHNTCQTFPLSFFYCSYFHLNPRHSNGKHSILCCAASTKKSRKLMSDADLCNGLREFVASVGLPEGHVPSTKELSEHGRKDLANIVRRRGHKLIKELLVSSSETVTDRSDLQENKNGELTGSCVHDEAGQEEKVNDGVEESTDVHLTNDESATGDSFLIKSESTVSYDDQSHLSVESPASLIEKVEKFMRCGELDAVEDDPHNDLVLNLIKEGEGSNSGDTLGEGESLTQGEVDTSYLVSIDSNSMGLNGTLTVGLKSPPTTDDNVTRDIYSSEQGQPYADIDVDMNIEASTTENEVEINRLKHMLHQKELELSRLKEDIEKEKEALSILQTKAENEISKAQKLISEKDAELHDAEESLSGLVEAEIQYSGEGQMVEVAGSFNGWHQRVKLYPQPSSAVMGPTGSRIPRLWSTTLWLYPGVYEIKFIVDGQWKIDPQREATIKGGIENNLLRVE